MEPDQFHLDFLVRTTSTSANILYREGTKDFMERHKPEEFNRMTALVPALTLFHAIEDARKDPDDLFLRQTVKILFDEIAFTGSDIANFMIADGVTGMDETKLKSRFFIDVHAAFALKDQSLKENVMRYYENFKGVSFVQYSRAIYYTLAQYYWTSTSREMRIANELFDYQKEWHEVSYTENPGEQFQAVKKRLSFLTDVNLNYSIRYIKKILEPLQNWGLFPKQALKNLAAPQSYVTKIDREKIITDTMVGFVVGFKNVAIEFGEKTLILQDLDENLRRASVDPFKFNIFYSIGIETQIQDSRSQIEKVTVHGAVQTILDNSDFKMRNGLNRVGLSFYERGGLEYLESVQSYTHTTHEYEDETQKIMNLPIAAIISRKGENIFLVELWIRKILGIEHVYIKKDPKTVLSGIGRPAVIIYLKGSAFFEWPNTNMYIIPKSEDKIYILNAEGQLLFPGNITKTTRAIKEHFQITETMADRLEYAILFDWTSNRPEKTPLLLFTWYANCILKGLTWNQIKFSPYIFGEKKLLSWVVNDYARYIEEFYPIKQEK